MSMSDYSPEALEDLWNLVDSFFDSRKALVLQGPSTY